jgi:CheY-like chemotaxis protein
MVRSKASSLCLTPYPSLVKTYVITPAKILVVDDTPRNVKLLADLLMVKGYSVVTAASGREALVSVYRERPDLVLLDVVMPEMSGYEVCRKIRENPETMLPSSW